MSPSVRTPWRLRAIALVGAGALATVAAVAPSEPAPEPSAAPSPVDTRDEPAVPQPTTPTDPPVTLSSPPLSEQVLIAASVDAIETAPEPTEAPEPTASADEAAAASAPDPEPARSVWDRVADCESGEWTGDGGFVTASANWSATAGLFEGGLQFHPDTWDGYRDPGMPGAAYDASREQQIVVAERVLAEQGWKAWPVCSRKLGLR